MCKEATLAAMRDTKTARGSFFDLLGELRYAKDSELQKVATEFANQKVPQGTIIDKGEPESIRRLNSANANNSINMNGGGMTPGGGFMRGGMGTPMGAGMAPNGVVGFRTGTPPPMRTPGSAGGFGSSAPPGSATTMGGRGGGFNSAGPPPPGSGMGFNRTGLAPRRDSPAREDAVHQVSRRITRRGVRTKEMRLAELYRVDGNRKQRRRCQLQRMVGTKTITINSSNNTNRRPTANIRRTRTTPVAEEVVVETTTTTTVTETIIITTTTTTTTATTITGTTTTTPVSAVTPRSETPANGC